MLHTIEVMQRKTYPFGSIPIGLAIEGRWARWALVVLLATWVPLGVSSPLSAVDSGQRPEPVPSLSSATGAFEFEVVPARKNLSLSGSLDLDNPYSAGNDWTDILGFSQPTHGEMSPVTQPSRANSGSSASRPLMPRSAHHVTVVPLGLHGGEVTLTRLEDGSYTLGSTLISHGDSVTGANGHQYRLFLADGEWFSAPIVASVSILLPNHQGSITLSRFEDGTYLYNGETVASGDSITVHGETYVLELDGLQGTASAMSPAPRPDLERVRPVGADGNTHDTLQTYSGTRPQLMDTEGSGAQAGSLLNVGARTYSLDELFTAGSVRENRTFVDNARTYISLRLTRVEVLLDLYEPGAGGIDEQIESIWDEIDDRLGQLFPGAGGSFLGEDVPKRSNGTTIDGEDLLDDINDVLDALEGIDEFDDALDGIFSDANVEETRIEAVFSSSESSENLEFSWTANTRFGAYSRAGTSEDGESLALLTGEEGLGAFAYSPLARVTTIQLPSAGQASYRGETVAASGLANYGTYRGPIELDVNFRSRRVSGRVLFLQDREGEAWVYGGDDLESILLPDARVSASDGSFSSATGAVAIADLIPFAGSVSQLALGSSLQGRFLGSDSDAGQAAIGTWEMRDDNGILLTGAFGTERLSASEPSPPPAITDDGAALTGFIAQPDANGLIEIAARDSDGDRIELSAAMLLSGGSTVLSGERLFSIADGIIRGQRDVLDVFDQLDDTSTSLRDLLWSNANTALKDHVFGSDGDDPLGSEYPAGGSIRSRDSRALSILGDALAALEGPSEFRESLGTGGVFDGQLGSESDLAGLDFFAIYDAREYDVEVQFGQTQFTRFGAWAKTSLEYAAGQAQESFGTDEDADVFAYSPIEQAGYRSNDPNFPSGLTSTYSGQTRGVDHGSGRPQFYFGDVAITVQWGGSAESSTVSAAIFDMTDITGLPFSYRGAEVSEIVFTGLGTEVEATSGLELSGSPTVRVRYADTTRGETGFGESSSLAGKFVGKQFGAPLGILGTWVLGDIKGAYGAELVP